jgi:hypothetical protein
LGYDFSDLKKESNYVSFASHIPPNFLTKFARGIACANEFCPQPPARSRREFLPQAVPTMADPQTARFSLLVRVPIAFHASYQPLKSLNNFRKE